LVAPLVVVDVSQRAAADPDTQGTVDDLLAWEQEHGPLPAGAFVALNAGWDALVGDPQRFLGIDAAGVPHFPGWHPEAAVFLVQERDIVGVGVDTVSLDFGASTDFGTHLTVLPAGKYGLESLANLGNVPPVGATIIVGGPRHLNASGGPTRPLALV
jgi:kynurenine formamidase